MTRVIMHGCNGHMGQVITKLAEEDTDVEIVAGVDPFDDGHNSYPVFSSIEKCDVDADVVIDFSSAKAEDALIDYCTASKLPVIVCTTGLSEAQLTKIREASEKVAVLKSANMSPVSIHYSSCSMMLQEYSVMRALMWNWLKSTTIRSWMHRVEQRWHWQILSKKC